MFSPIVLTSKYVTKLQDIDNEQVNKDVIARQSMKLDDDPGHTFAEDSYYPDTPACKQLLNQVDTCIKDNIVKRFETYNTWAHILEPNESTMIHTHDSPGIPPHLSWVYYSKTSPKCGNIVWQTTIHNRIVVMEETPEVGTLIVFPSWMPHFTKKNISGNIRISISGNARPVNDDYAAVGNDPGSLFSVIGVTQ